MILPSPYLAGGWNQASLESFWNPSSCKNEDCGMMIECSWGDWQHPVHSVPHYCSHSPVDQQGLWLPSPVWALSPVFVPNLRFSWLLSTARAERASFLVHTLYNSMKGLNSRLAYLMCVSWSRRWGSKTDNFRASPNLNHLANLSSPTRNQSGELKTWTAYLYQPTASSLQVKFLS